MTTSKTSRQPRPVGTQESKRPKKASIPEQPVLNQARETASGLNRQWQLLSRLTTGKWTGTRQLQEQLEREGIEISLRTIQRDLNQLAARFPIESNREIPQGWRWQADAPVQSLPHMNSSQAVTFLMVEQHLRQLLPPSLLDEMRPWFDMAKRNLTGERHHGRQWLNRVRIIPPTQPLIPPHVDYQTQQVLYESLLLERQIEASYQNRENTLKQYILNPVALIQRGPVIYLICRRNDREFVQMFALHRFMKARMLDARSTPPVQFDLDEYVESGVLGFQAVGDQRVVPIAITLLMTQQAAKGLLECPLSTDQTVAVTDNSLIRLSATVPHTQQLIWWLRGFGKSLKAVEPLSLAAEVWEMSAASSSTNPALATG